MPRCCNVSGCKSNYRSQKEAVSTFAIPKSEPQRSQWLCNIPTDLSGLKNPVVCIKHFNESCVIRIDKLIVRGEYKEFPRILPKLKEGSLPTVFPNLPKYLNSIPSSSKRLADVESDNLEQVIKKSLVEHKKYLEEKSIKGEMRSCCVPLCDSIRGKDKIAYHEMPSNDMLREQWIKVIYEHGTNVGTESVRPINPDDFVCGRHFTADDYKPSNKARYLKPDAIPSVFPQHRLKSRLAKRNGVMNVTASSKSKKQSLLVVSHHQASVLSDQNSSDPAALNCEAKKVKKFKKGKQSARKGLTRGKKLKTDMQDETGSSDELPDVIFVDEKPVEPETLKKLSPSTAITGAMNSLNNVRILLSPTKVGITSLSSEAIANSCTFETSNRLSPRSSLESSKDSVTAVHGNNIETSSPASLQEKLDLAEQEIKNLQNYVTKLKEQNVKLHWEKQSTLVRHLHDIRRDAVEGNYDAIMLLNQIVHYTLQRT